MTELTEKQAQSLVDSLVDQFCIEPLDEETELNAFTFIRAWEERTGVRLTSKQARDRLASLESQGLIVPLDKKRICPITEKELKAWRGR